MARIRWTPEQCKQLEELYPNHSCRQISEIMGIPVRSVTDKTFRMKIPKSPEWKDNPNNGRLKKGSTVGWKTWYAKGYVSHNKGKKQSEYMSAEAIEKVKQTHFKKGHKPANTMTDGDIVKRWHTGDQCYYKFIRIGPRQWKQLHHKVWEDANGPIPKRMRIRFKDKDRENCALENLELITIEENMKRNSIHELYPEEIKQTILKLGHLKRVINGKKQNH